MISSWADPLVRVNRQKEDSVKLELSQLLVKIRTCEDRIKELRAELKARQRQTVMLTTKAVAPDALCRILSYCKYIQEEILQGVGCREKLENEERYLREKLKLVAQKRILLESVQQKHMKAVIAEITQREERFVSEITRYKFIEDVQNDGQTS